MDVGHHRAYLARMNLPPDQPPSSSAKPKHARQVRDAREVERLRSISLRTAIGQELDHRGIVDPAAIGAILEMPALETKRLLELYQWREGDMALLEAIAAKLGVQVPG
jgi:hypothetical protein